MNILPIVNRLRAEGAADMQFIKGSVDFAQAMEQPPRVTPVQYVVLGQETDAPNAFMTQIVAQRRTVDFSVVTVVERLSDNLGDATDDSLESIRQPTLAALQGFVPAVGYDPIEANGGSLLGMKDGQLWWQDKFRTKYENRTGVSP